MSEDEIIDINGGGFFIDAAKKCVNDNVQPHRQDGGTLISTSRSAFDEMITPEMRHEASKWAIDKIFAQIVGNMKNAGHSAMRSTTKAPGFFFLNQVKGGALLALPYGVVIPIGKANVIDTDEYCDDQINKQLKKVAEGEAGAKEFDAIKLRMRGKLKNGEIIEEVDWEE